MSAIITSNFRINNAKSYLKAFTGSDTYYLFIGRTQSWPSDTSPNTPTDNPKEFFEILKDTVALKRILSDDVSLAILRRNWVINKYYNIYRHDYGPGTTGIDYNSGSSVSLTSLEDANFYVVNSNYDVYKCINNTNSSGVVVPSTSEPTGTGTSIFSTSDGYSWKYMFSVPTASAEKFITKDFIPVKEITTVVNSGDPYYNQYQTQIASINGGIHNIVVTSGGSSYSTAPAITIAGDGTGAAASVTISGNSVVKITITNPGSNYTYASVNFSGGGGSGAAATAIISPPGGHGKNSSSELYGYYTITNAKLDGSESNKFPIINDFRRLGIIKNPLDFTTGLTLTSSVARTTKALIINSLVGTFAVDELIVSNGSSSPNARIVAFYSTGTSGEYVMTYIKTSSENTISFSTSELITGQTSGATATITGLMNPDATINTAELLYYENRNPINRASDQSEDVRIVVQQ